jgi:PTS system mannose-specific IIA component
MNADNVPMVAILIVAHAPLASALRQVALHVFPDAAERLRALDIDSDAPLAQTLAQAQEQLDLLGASPCLILTDAMGATPCNLASALLHNAAGLERRVVSGVSVPMLWRAIGYAHEPIDALVQRAIQGASTGVVEVKLDQLCRG